MSDLKILCLWTLIIIHADTGQCSTIQFVAREKGDAVVLSCLVDQTTSPPMGVYLKRSWLRHTNVLFKYEGSEVSVLDQDYHNRTSVSGDPTIRALNVTISDLRPSDTDRYYCEFNVNNPRSADTVLRGSTDFFLYVSGGMTISSSVSHVPHCADDHDSCPDRKCSGPHHCDIKGINVEQKQAKFLDVERDWVNTCVGGSALLPCVPPVGDSSAVEGVVLKRQRGQQPVELLYHSKHTSWPSQLSVDRVQLSTAPGPGGISYSLTVGALQPEDSGLYSCQLLLLGRPHSPSMGPQGIYVSVQGDQCGCSSYSTLIYALSAAVAVTFVLLVVAVLVHRGNRQRSNVIQTPAPIYEEMTGLQPNNPKRAMGHTDDTQSEYRNISLKDPCPENHYESPKRPINSKKK